MASACADQRQRLPRYLPKNSDKKQYRLAVTAAGTSSVLLALLEQRSRLPFRSPPTPSRGSPRLCFLVPHPVPHPHNRPAFAINSIDLYSSGLTLQAIGLKIKRWQAVLVDTVVSGVITAVVIFSASFNTFLTDFLLFMIIWIAPWVGIFLVD